MLWAFNLKINREREKIEEKGKAEAETGVMCP